jgi:shikimate dehydrogenase
MRTFGLIGFPLSHSFSQKYFSEKFRRENISDAEFKNFPLENIKDFPNLIESNPSLCGLSVTIPHKQSVMKFLDEIDDVAKEAGAVNCIRVSPMSDVRRPTLIGFNTDIFGFEKSLLPLLKSHHTKALILGSGGGAKAVKYVLKKSGVEYVFVSRSQKPAASSYSYNDLDNEIISSHTLIINTTPLGMFPDVDSFPAIPYEYLTEKHLLYDLVYNPQETLFLKKGKEKGAQVKNGLEMLQLQADKAWEIWNSH